MGSISRRSSGGSRQRSRESGGGRGGFVAQCFGGGNAASDVQETEHTHDDDMAQSYNITDTGGILENKQGKEFMSHFHSIVHSNYKDCFKKFKD